MVWLVGWLVPTSALIRLNCGLLSSSCSNRYCTVIHVHLYCEGCVIICGYLWVTQYGIPEPDPTLGNKKTDLVPTHNKILNSTRWKDIHRVRIRYEILIKWKEIENKYFEIKNNIYLKFAFLIHSDTDKSAGGQNWRNWPPLNKEYSRFLP